MIAYKTLSDNNRSQYQGFEWPLPKDGSGEPGEWVEARGVLALCGNGIHGWLTEEIAIRKGRDVAPNVYEMELEVDVGETAPADEVKVCARRGRLLRLVHDRHGPVVRLADLVWQ